MQLVQGTDAVPASARGGVVAIGNFDGVHRGHKGVLAHTAAEARCVGGPAGVLMFEPHPRQFFAPNAPHFTLTTLPERLRLMAGLGLDFAAVLQFNAGLASLDAASFIERVLVAGLGVRGVVVGYDFHFGKGRQGSPDLLRSEGAQRGFAVTVIEPQGHAGDVFSSTRVRALLAKGQVREAADVLGHWWRISGTVVAGARRGSGFGFPTANIALPAGTALGHGIYAVRVVVDGRRHGGAAYLGTRPTFDNGPAVLEVFLLDFDADLYGSTIAVDFIAHIRGDQAFANPAALTAQMELDCLRAREVLAAVGRHDPMQAFTLGQLPG